jgi:hypothetical protein
MPEQRETVGECIDRKRELFDGEITADKGERIREAKTALADDIDEVISRFVPSETGMRRYWNE